MIDDRSRGVAERCFGTRGTRVSRVGESVSRWWGGGVWGGPDGRWGNGCREFLGFLGFLGLVLVDAVIMADGLEEQGFVGVEETEYGFCQRAVYAHPDLCHEDLLELDSPFASSAVAGTGVYTFLLLGDQNAGKSTFLHAWANPSAPHFLSLTSWLPFLSSSFANVRILDERGPVAPGDEPPFLDTDLGRASLLLTLEAFGFFVSEFKLPPSLVTDLDISRVRYVSLSFVEIGGDHLDRIMMDDTDLIAAPEPGLLSIVDSSRALVASVSSAAYFVNGRDFVLHDGTAGASRHKDVILARLLYLDAIAAAQNGEDGQEGRMALTLMVTRIPGEPGSLEVESVRKRFELWIQEEVAEKVPHLVLGTVLAPAHVGQDGVLVADQIMHTLSQLFARSSFSSGPNSGVSAASVAGVAAFALVSCFKDTAASSAGSESGLLDLYVDKDMFEDWLDDQDVPDLPPPLLLQSFAGTVSALTEGPGTIGLVDVGGGFAGLSVRVGDMIWRHQDPQQGKKKTAVRFPIYAPLMAEFEFFVSRNVAPQYWVSSLADQGMDEERVGALLAGLEREVERTTDPRVLIMLLEDVWLLLHRHGKVEWRVGVLDRIVDLLDQAEWLVVEDVDAGEGPEGVGMMLLQLSSDRE